MTKDVSALTDQEMENIRRMLELKKEYLKSNREFRLAQIKDGTEALKDAADIAGREEDVEKMWYFINRDQTTENKINDALKRMESGNYGRCVECDAHISYKRLQIDPTSDLCINCKNELEMEDNNTNKRLIN